MGCMWSPYISPAICFVFSSKEFEVGADFRRLLSQAPDRGVCRGPNPCSWLTLQSITLEFRSVCSTVPDSAICGIWWLSNVYDISLLYSTLTRVFITTPHPSSLPSPPCAWQVLQSLAWSMASWGKSCRAAAGVLSRVPDRGEAGCSGPLPAGKLAVTAPAAAAQRSSASSSIVVPAFINLRGE